jgi:hypothetical protein
MPFYPFGERIHDTLERFAERVSAYPEVGDDSGGRHTLLSLSH